MRRFVSCGSFRKQGTGETDPSDLFRSKPFPLVSCLASDSRPVRVLDVRILTHRPRAFQRCCRNSTIHWTRTFIRTATAKKKRPCRPWYEGETRVQRKDTSSKPDAASLVFEIVPRCRLVPRTAHRSNRRIPNGSQNVGTKRGANSTSLVAAWKDHSTRVHERMVRRTRSDSLRIVTRRARSEALASSFDGTGPILHVGRPRRGSDA